MRFLVLVPLLVAQVSWGASVAETELNRPALLKDVRIEKGGIAHLTKVAKDAGAAGDLVLTYYCHKGTSKCDLQKVQVTESPLKK